MGVLQDIASKAVRLKMLLPETNISLLVSAWPGLILQQDMDTIELRLHSLR